MADVQWRLSQVEHNAYPAPLHYFDFPKSVCTSVNEVVCHGIPDLRELVDGDIVNVDVSAILDGYHTDLNETWELILTYGFGAHNLVVDPRKQEGPVEWSPGHIPDITHPITHAALNKASGGFHNFSAQALDAQVAKVGCPAPSTASHGA